MFVRILESKKVIKLQGLKKVIFEGFVKLK